MTLPEMMTITDGRTESEVAAVLHALYPRADRPMLLATADLLAQYRCAQAHPNTAWFLEHMLTQRLAYLQRHI